MHRNNLLKQQTRIFRMPDLSRVAFKVRLPASTSSGFQTTWKYCEGGKYADVPRPGDEFELGGSKYVVEARRLPLFKDWRKYGKPPVVWAREIER